MSGCHQGVSSSARSGASGFRAREHVQLAVHDQMRDEYAADRRDRPDFDVLLLRAGEQQRPLVQRGRDGARVASSACSWPSSSERSTSFT